MIISLALSGSLVFSAPQVVTDIKVVEQSKQPIPHTKEFPAQQEIDKERANSDAITVDPVSQVAEIETNAVEWVDYGVVQLADSGKVKVVMNSGRLEPQVRKIIKVLGNVNSDMSELSLVWKANRSYTWQNDVVLEERSLMSFLDKLITSYGLSFDITDSGVVVVYE